MQQLSVDNQIIRKLKPVWIITNPSLKTEWRRRGSYSVLSRINITTKPRVFQYQIFAVDHKLSEKSARRACFRWNNDNPDLSRILTHIAYTWDTCSLVYFFNFSSVFWFNLIMNQILYSKFYCNNLAFAGKLGKQRSLLIITAVLLHLIHLLYISVKLFFS